MKTASWFTKLPNDHKRIGISRGTPRRIPAGYRIYRALSPGPWFNSVGIEEYCHRYRTEILERLDPWTVADDLARLSEGSIPVIVCYERPGTGKWCHRSLAAKWLADALGLVVPEVGFETLPQQEHPLMPPRLQRVDTPHGVPDLTQYVDRNATVDGELHRVVTVDRDKPGKAIVAAGDRRFATRIDTLRRHFKNP